MAKEPENQSQSSILGNAGSKWIHAFIGVLRSRLELFLFELEEQKVRLVELILWLVCLVIFGLIFLGVTSAAIVFLLPADWRGVGALVLALIYGLIACTSVWRIRSIVSQESPVFEESLAQLKKDQACFSDQK
jgi:uncharacterized membrane protein YqjE